MRIVFFNINHIGDVYFSSLFINNICNLNNNITFYYYFIQGDIFFSNIKNIKRIKTIDNDYRDNLGKKIKLKNGNTPEDFLNKDMIFFIKEKVGDNTKYKIININNQDYLYINTWCGALNFSDYDIQTGIEKMQALINNINIQFSLNLLFNFNNLELGYNIEKNYIKQTINYTILKESIFIFNYHPRSLTFNILKLNNFITELSKKNKIILPAYDNYFDNNENINFCDIKYNILPTINCENLLQIWEIAKHCKQIFILPTGSSWTFLHILDELQNDKITIINGSQYKDKLNNLNKYFKSDIYIKNINI